MRLFLAGAAAVVVAGYAATWAIGNEYYLYAGYTVLQYVALATAWNLLGGYAGYVNFGAAGFFATGTYAVVALEKVTGWPLLALLPGAAVVGGLLGLGAGYLTLRLRGVYFAIATLALAIVLETAIANWEFVGGAAGAFIVRPREAPFFASYIAWLFWLMLVIAVFAVCVARAVETSRLGRGLGAVRGDERAAESAGVPTLRLKLVATTLSGALMGLSGAPLVYYTSYVDPPSAFNLEYAVNAVAMPMIGGTMTWAGPVIGAVLLGALQQAATVTVSSELNLLIVGAVLIVFVIAAPEGIVGLARRLLARRR